MAETKCKQHIGEGSIILLVGSALFFDAFGFFVGLIPFIGWIFSPLIMAGGIAFITLIFVMRGVPQFKSKQDLGMFATRLLELVPLLNVLPWLTLSTILNIIRQRRKDRKCFESERQKNVSGKNTPNQQPQPANNRQAAVGGGAAAAPTSTSESDEGEDPYENDVFDGGYEDEEEPFEFDDEREAA